jgi:uncharacterized phage-associated protein
MLPFDEGKSTQAAAMFLKLRGGQMSYMKLIKLLYLADRTSLLRFGKPITMDRWYSMKHGPVLSNVLNLITDPSRVDSKGTWAQLISPPLGDHEVSLLVEDVPNDRLSVAEENIVSEVFERYGGISRWDLVELLHQGVVAPEWREPTKGSRVPISLLDVLTTEMEPEEAELAENELMSMVHTRHHVMA